MIRTTGRILLIVAATFLGPLAVAPRADNGSAAPAAGSNTKPAPAAPITVGDLARSLLAEIAVNSPTGGFDESSALGIMGAVGYDAKRPSSSVATVGDLRSMLSIFGVDSKTKNPAEPLTAARVAATLKTVRSTLPHFSVPLNEGEKSGKDDSQGDSRPGPCQIALQACKAKCHDRSPSGGGDHGLSGCVQECNAAFDECRRRLFSHGDGR